jgi:CO dehydrogenase/acetyl-CoA synthase beta subunit
MSNSYNVKVGNLNTTRVRLGSQNAIQVVASNLSSAGQVIGGIAVDFSNIQDNFVLQYDANLNKIIAVNPDQVLQDAVPGGIPDDFINVLDTDLNRGQNIDFDGGNFQKYLNSIKEYCKKNGKPIIKI